MNLVGTRNGRRVLFTLLYLVEGAPIGYVWWALPTRLRAADVPIEDITFLAAVLTLPWTFKFLWAPLVDSLRSRRGGLRLWIAGAQLAMGLTLLPVVSLDPARDYSLLMLALIAHAFCAATQDVSIDALAVASIPPEDRGQMSGWMQFGMLMGRGTFGGLSLWVEQFVGPGVVIAAMIALLWSASGLIWLTSEPLVQVLGSAR